VVALVTTHRLFCVAEGRSAGIAQETDPIRWKTVAAVNLIVGCRVHDQMDVAEIEAVYINMQSTDQIAAQFCTPHFFQLGDPLGSAVSWVHKWVGFG
jgi:hypothetical protein